MKHTSHFRWFPFLFLCSPEERDVTGCIVSTLSPHRLIIIIVWFNEISSLGVIWSLTSWLDNDLHAWCRQGIRTSQNMENRKWHPLHLEEKNMNSVIRAERVVFALKHGEGMWKIMAPSKWSYQSEYKYFRGFEEYLRLVTDCVTNWLWAGPQ